MAVGERVLFGGVSWKAKSWRGANWDCARSVFGRTTGKAWRQNIEHLGHVPLPPYIDRPDESSDRERYQTVYAQKPGAVAAPTAGLHFTPEILQTNTKPRLRNMRDHLDVGLGTFQPIHTEILEEHRIHSEAYEIREEAAEKIFARRKEDAA